MGKLLKMGEAAQYINVSQDCLRKWDRANKLKPLKTAGGHRRYSTDVLDEMEGERIIGVRSTEFTLVEKPTVDGRTLCS